MAKELPFFQFEPAEYLTKDISFCSISAQGLFINICAYYWQRGCNLTKNQLLKRLNYLDELNELLEENVISLDGESIKIKFLDEQWSKAIEFSKLQSERGRKGGRPKKENKPELNPNETQSKPNQKPKEEKRREDKKKEDKIKDKLLNSHFWIEMIAKNKGLTLQQTQTTLKNFLNELEMKEDLDKPEKEIKSHFINFLNKKLEMNENVVALPKRKTLKEL